MPSTIDLKYLGERDRRTESCSNAKLRLLRAWQLTGNHAKNSPEVTDEFEGRTVVVPITLTVPELGTQLSRSSK